MEMPHRPWPKAKDKIQDLENKAWYLYREVKRGAMLPQEADRLLQQLYRQVKSDPLPDERQEYLKMLLLRRGSTY